MTDYVVGIDLGATKIALGLIDPSDHITARDRLPTHTEAGPAQAVERIAASIERLAASLPPARRISAVGVCTPGPVDHQTGVIIDPPNLTGWRNVPFQQMLAQRLGVPVVLEHDAKAAALGEFHYGVGRGTRSMVYVVAGTGVGAAIIIDGQLYRGVHNFAGEVGQMTVDRHAPAYDTSVPGAVQEYIRGPALVREYTRLVTQNNPAAPVAELTGEDVAIAAAAGDSLAVAVLEQAGQVLGTAIGSMALILDIDFYVIGGSVIKSGDLLLNTARQTLPRFCLPSVAAHVRIEPAALGDDSPLLGCAYLARTAS